MRVATHNLVPDGSVLVLCNLEVLLKLHLVWLLGLLDEVLLPVLDWGGCGVGHCGV